MAITHDVPSTTDVGRADSIFGESNYTFETLALHAGTPPDPTTVISTCSSLRSESVSYQPLCRQVCRLLASQSSTVWHVGSGCSPLGVPKFSS